MDHYGFEIIAVSKNERSWESMIGTMIGYVKLVHEIFSVYTNNLAYIQSLND